VKPETQVCYCQELISMRVPKLYWFASIKRNGIVAQALTAHFGRPWSCANVRPASETAIARIEVRILADRGDRSVEVRLKSR
jgi:hypothetical protein